MCATAAAASPPQNATPLLHSLVGVAMVGRLKFCILQSGFCGQQLKSQSTTKSNRLLSHLANGFPMHTFDPTNMSVHTEHSSPKSSPVYSFVATSERNRKRNITKYRQNTQNTENRKNRRMYRQIHECKGQPKKVNKQVIA